MSAEERRSLIRDEDESSDVAALDHVIDLAEENHPSAKQLYWNFWLMALGFSINHGCVVSCLAYSTAELGTQLGGYGSGVLYVFYALTALFLSKPVVAGLGSKWGLILGTSGYCVYVAAFLVAVLFQEGPIAWIVFLTSCAIGGCAGGILWTAQGRYFARNAAKYTEALEREKTYGDTKALGLEEGVRGSAGGGTPTPSSENTAAATAEFAGIFALMYLGLETLCKISSTAIFVIMDDGRAKTTVFSFYSCAAILAAIVITRLNHLNDGGEGGISMDAVKRGALDASNLVRTDARLALLIPYQLNFGIISTFVPYYIFGVVVAGSSQLGGNWVGALSAIITATGAIMGMPTAWLTKKVGQAVPMTIGGLCTMATGATVYFWSEEQMGHWSFIVPLLIVYGIGRGTWENTNKAVVASLYSDAPQHIASAFASVSFSNGFMGAIAYFVFPSLEPKELGGGVIFFSTLAIASYFISLSVKKND